MSEIALPRCLEDARIASIPNVAYYVPRFVSLEEERALLEKVTARPLRDWTILSKRRLQAWPSALHNERVLDSPLPHWLRNPIIPRVAKLVMSASHATHIFSSSPHGAPNHVLINEYEPGTGIMPHVDGQAYHPVVATVSLGSHTVLNLHEKAADGGHIQDPRFRILQERGSLLITTDKLYTDFLHGIADIEEDLNLGPKSIVNWDILGDREMFASGACQRATRISLTYRDVLQVRRPTKLLPGLLRGTG